MINNLGILYLGNLHMLKKTILRVKKNKKLFLFLKLRIKVKKIIEDQKRNQKNKHCYNL